MSVEDELVVELCKRMADPIEVSTETRIYHDAGLDGEDFDDFIDWFSTRFRVDMTGFNYRMFAPPEHPPLRIFRLPWPFSRDAPEAFVPLTVKDLSRVATAGSWRGSSLAEEVNLRRPEVFPPAV